MGHRWQAQRLRLVPYRRQQGVQWAFRQEVSFLLWQRRRGWIFSVQMPRPGSVFEREPQMVFSREQISASRTWRPRKTDIHPHPLPGPKPCSLDSCENPYLNLLPNRCAKADEELQSRIRSPHVSYAIRWSTVTTLTGTIYDIHREFFVISA